LPPELICIAIGVVIAAYVVKGFTGFGAGVVLVSILSLMMDFKLVVAVGCACAVGNGIMLAPGARRHVDWRAILWLLTSCIVGVFVGTHALKELDRELLRRCYGAFIICFALYTLWHERRADLPQPEPWPEWIAPICGLAAGVILGLFGAGGPAMVVYLAHRLRRKEVLRGTLIMVLSITDVLRMGLYAWQGIMTQQVLMLSCYVVPAAIAGGFIGTRMHGRADPRTFRIVVAVVLLAIGVRLVAK